MQPEKRVVVKEFAQRFWASTDNVKQFQTIESGVREGVDALLSRGNVALMNRFVMTTERSHMARIEAGVPIYEFEGSRK
jgi:uncharacterized protein YicC (UPF0701 family)